MIFNLVFICSYYFDMISSLNVSFWVKCIEVCEIENEVVFK